jgi:hypothetical protein
MCASQRVVRRRLARAGQAWCSLASTSFRLENALRFVAVLSPIIVGLCASVALGGCSSSPSGSPSKHPDGGQSDAIADAGPDAVDAADAGYPVPGPGEQCVDPQPTYIDVRIQPDRIVVAPGESRVAKVFVEPDFCVPVTMSFKVDDPTIAAPPPSGTIELGTPMIPVTLKGLKIGTTTLTAILPRGNGQNATASIPIEVMSPQIAACSGSGSGHLDDGVTVHGTGGLAGASIGLQVGATKPNSGSFLWHVSPFDVTLACAKDQVPTGFTKLGPAVTFGPTTVELNREIPFTLPINPAVMPPKAHLRHVTVSYTGPMVNKPRVIPIADPRIVHDQNGYELYFMAPWLGTYQALVKSDAGTVTFTRHLTHRAVIGVSMGGGGAAMFGLRHHQEFDVIAPLGGPVDWTWMLGFIQRNQIGGFLPNTGATPPTQLAPMPPAPLPYEHAETFNQWWYEYPNAGNGGTFARRDDIQIFRDLALMFGDPDSYNPAPNGENLPAGVPPDDPSVVGDHPGRECAVWVDPISTDPNYAQEQEIAQDCPIERCSHTLVLSNYYDATFNPNGTYPVITVCDGSPQQKNLSPYSDTWQATGNNFPLELALAVDYNGNGVRDEDEPIIQQGQEPFQDVGTDGLADPDEPGYQAGVNEDPDGDDWNPQYNPTGTEGNYRWDPGEPYQDYGLDGVPNTKSSPYDYGEGDGQFTMAPGLKTFLERDSRTVLEQLPMATQQYPLDDAALQRLDLWTDGGTRDMFNFEVDAEALAGSWAARGRIVHYYTAFDRIPGQVWGQPNQYVAGDTNWDDVPGGVMMRYGHIDPSAQDIADGSGQHVGTVDEIADRLESALFYIGSRWPDAPHTDDIPAAVNPDPSAPECEIQGSCDFTFTDSLGRTGPVSVSLPPGYANADNKKRYPVIYMLHGYGQTPEDLKAAIIFLSNWMNSTADSEATRLPKAIVVYVDGRCRDGQNGAECIQGTFYTDSVRPDGPKMAQWFDELIQEIDKRYRTMPPSDVSWTE